MEDNMNPQELEQKRQEALAAGYTEDEINQYVQSINTPQPQQGVGAMDRSEEYTGLAQGIGLDAATKAVEYGVPAAAAYYGGKKLIQNFRGTPTAQQAQQAQQATRSFATPTQQAVNASRPSLTVQQGGLSSGPVQPTSPTTPPPTQPSSMVQRGIDYTNKIREIAMNKVLQNVAKGGTAAAAMLTPGNIGQNYPVPQQGPYRGMEINPMTNRPWTPQELAQINR